MRRCQMCRMIIWPWKKGDVADCKVSGFEHLHERCIGYINESDWTDMSDYQRWDEANRRPGRIPLVRPWKKFMAIESNHNRGHDDT